MIEKTNESKRYNSELFELKAKQCNVPAKSQQSSVKLKFWHRTYVNTIDMKFGLDSGDRLHHVFQSLTHVMLLVKTFFFIPFNQGRNHRGGHGGRVPRAPYHVPPTSKWQQTVCLRSWLLTSDVALYYSV